MWPFQHCSLDSLLEPAPFGKALGKRLLACDLVQVVCKGQKAAAHLSVLYGTV